MTHLHSWAGTPFLDEQCWVRAHQRKRPNERFMVLCQECGDKYCLVCAEQIPGYA